MVIRVEQKLVRRLVLVVRIREHARMLSKRLRNDFQRRFREHEIDHVIPLAMLFQIAAGNDTACTIQYRLAQYNIVLHNTISYYIMEKKDSK